jgi:hypothetical protein
MASGTRTRPPVAQRPTAGVEIRRRIVPEELTDAALRLLHLDLITRGASAAELGEWLWAVNWFPHLRHDPRITALAQALPAAWRTGQICEPQILLQFPHAGPEPEISFHLDREPDWAGERRYERIVGIALSRWDRENGGLLIDRPGKEPLGVELDPGDAVMMKREVWHSAGINRTGSIRYAVYFRWLGA